MSLQSDFYKQQLLAVRTNTAHGRPCMAKPALLLAIIDTIASGDIKRNEFGYDNLLPAYHRLWAQLKLRPTPMRYPFYHLTSDGFFHLTTPLGNIRPAVGLLRAPSCRAHFDQPLWDLLQDSTIRTEFRTALTDFFVTPHLTHKTPYGN